jgi:hypothetical protein
LDGVALFADDESPQVEEGFLVWIDLAASKAKRFDGHLSIGLHEEADDLLIDTSELPLRN